MTNKRIHKNGRYAKRFGNDRVERDQYNLYQKDIAKGRITEQELKDFGFEPVPDVYEECAKEIDDANMEMLHLETIEEILKKHFSKFVDSND